MADQYSQHTESFGEVPNAIRDVRVDSHVQEAFEPLTTWCENSECTILRTYLFNRNLDYPMQQDVSLEISLDQQHCSQQSLEPCWILYVAIRHLRSISCPPAQRRHSTNGIESPVLPYHSRQRD